jgi:hypothetical protein
VLLNKHTTGSYIPAVCLMSGPDGIRTRALGLDRAACSAATPRDLATGSLLYIGYIVKLRDYKNRGGNPHQGSIIRSMVTIG